MPQATYGLTLAVGGVSIQKTSVKSGDHSNTYEILLPAALPVTGWTNVDFNTGSCTLPGGHGQTNGKFDVYWEEAGVKKLRYGVDGTISVNTLSLDGGDGDNFPPTSTPGVVVCKQVPINTAIDGDAIEIIGFSLEYPDAAAASVGHVDMQDGGAVTIEEIDLQANMPVVFDIDGGATNVFTGNPITSTKASHNHTGLEATLKIVSLQDSTP